MPKIFRIAAATWTAVVLCAWFVEPGSALKCHVCNSIYNETCDDITDDRFLMECDKVDMDEAKNHTNCRKETFSAYSKAFEMHTQRTVRSCGYETHIRRCFYSSNIDLKGTTCECFEDGCNGSNMLHLASKSLLLVVLCAFLASVLAT